MILNDFIKALRETEEVLTNYYDKTYLATCNDQERELLAYMIINTDDSKLAAKIVESLKKSKSNMKYSLLGN